MQARFERVLAFLFTAVACGSLAGCTIVLLLWPVGYWRRVNVNYTFGQVQVDVQTADGSLSVGRYVYPQTVPRFQRGWSGRLHPLEPDDGGWLDFGHLHHDRFVPQDNLFDAVWFPHWFGAVLLGVLPAMWLVRYRRHRERFLQGRCRRCGYDLRATPEQCPECGWAPKSRAIGWGGLSAPGE